MDARVWVLVEWEDKSNMFPKYGVVNVSTMYNGNGTLRPGKIIHIRQRHENTPRPGRIMRISDNKQHCKEHKLMLERQDRQLQNVFSMCMRGIQELKNNDIRYGGLNAGTSSDVTNGPPHVVADEDSSSDSDHEQENPPTRKRSFKTSQKFNQSRFNTSCSSISQNGQALVQRRRSLVSSTPLPGVADHNTIKLTFDQATQTDPLPSESPERMQELETLVTNLWEQFKNIVIGLNLQDQIPLTLSDSETEKNGVQENGDAAVEVNGVAENPGNQSSTEHEELVVNEEDSEGSAENSASSPAAEDQVGQQARTLRVRRVSAQTTNNVEANGSDMVSLGNGFVTIPARVMNDIDWTSHTTATRQLLQAIFPRRVLATHSLTGKQSPAFANKPPKNCLDPKIVNDIVDTVAQRCGVAKRQVRGVITIKCTDEAKLYRNRQKFIAPRYIGNANRENVPPSTSSPTSDESNVTN